MPDINEGSPAPAFDLPTDGGGRVSSEALKGRAVVLFFYPKADTPGCTNEAKDFSERAAAFQAANTVVIGVSRDAVRKLDRFKAKHELQVTLASDEATDVCDRFGVWGEKTLYGRKYMGIERATFLIGPDGVVRRAWRKVSVKGHAEEVLTAARAL